MELMKQLCSYAEEKPCFSTLIVSSTTLQDEHNSRLHAHKTSPAMPYIVIKLKPTWVHRDVEKPNSS